jgi:hyperosmotically inducible periplasmic protein
LQASGWDGAICQTKVPNPPRCLFRHNVRVAAAQALGARVSHEQVAKSSTPVTRRQACGTIHGCSLDHPAFCGEGCRGSCAGRCSEVHRPDVWAATLNDFKEGDSMKLRIVSLILLAVLACPSFAWQNQGSDKTTQRIQKEVRHELVMLPYLGVFDNLAYKVDGSTVTLFGQVTRPSLKGDAERVVKGIEGVDKVDNQIDVLPPSSMDDQLRRRLYRAIYGFPSLQKYSLGVQQPIRIIVKSGRVTLEGVVDNEADKNAAGIRANGVSGIFSVTNNLQVVKP